MNHEKRRATVSTGILELLAQELPPRATVYRLERTKRRGALWWLVDLLTWGSMADLERGKDLPRAWYLAATPDSRTALCVESGLVIARIPLGRDAHSAVRLLFSYRADGYTYRVVAKVGSLA